MSKTVDLKCILEVHDDLSNEVLKEILTEVLNDVEYLPVEVEYLEVKSRG